MRYLSKEELGTLYLIIERAVETKSEVKFPKKFSSQLSLIVVNNGFRFIIPKLHWQKGEKRYNALLRMDFKDNNLNTPCLYVDDYITSGNIIGDELWMFSAVRLEHNMVFESYCTKDKYRDKLPYYIFTDD